MLGTFTIDLWCVRTLTLFHCGDHAQSVGLTFEELPKSLAFSLMLSVANCALWKMRSVYNMGGCELYHEVDSLSSDKGASCTV